MPNIFPAPEFEEQTTLEDSRKLIDELAEKIVRRRLETAAIMFLEIHKPLAFLAGQSILMVSPFLIPLFGVDGVRRYSNLLTVPDSVELLIQRIEELVLLRDSSTSSEESKCPTQHGQ